MSRGAWPIWGSFVWAALGLAIVAGFGLGADLFLLQALHAPTSTVWPVAAQAHGHVQLFGWAGLMVLGVGLHFLPRLRGAPLSHPDRARAALVLLVAGLALRVLAAPLLAAVAATPRLAPLLAPLRVSLLGSGLLEAAGAGLALAELVLLARRDPPLRAQPRLWPLVPFFIAAFAALWLALAVNVLGLVAAMSGRGLVPDRIDAITIQLAFYGFLIPISVAMSERTFPLFLRTPVPDIRLLHGGLAVLLAGLAARIGGEAADAPAAVGLGQLALAAALCLFVLALGIFAPRRPLPRQPVRPLADPIQLHALSAYVWLLLEALSLIATGLAALGVRGAALTLDTPDAEHHLLGAGFVTLLILGMGAQLLPGFANRRPRSRALIWATLALGNAAALLRVGPLFIPAGVSPALENALLSAAGIAGLFALLAFGLNLTGRRRSPEARVHQT